MKKYYEASGYGGGEVEKKEEEKKFKVEGVPDDVLEKIIEKSSIWNDEIRPHFFKGMVLGWRMANKSPSVILTESLAGEAAHRYAAKVFDGCDREDQSEYDHFVNHLLSFIKSLNIKQ